MKNCLIIIPLLIILSNSIQAQDLRNFASNTTIESWNKEFTIEPTYSFIHGLKLNFDFPLKSKRQYLITQPIIFFNNNNNDLFESRNYESMQGFGLQLGHRIYLQPKNFLKSIYFQYNTLAHRYKTNHDELAPVESLQDGIYYTNFEQSKFSKKFTKTGFDVLFGKQYFMDDLFVFDIYTGVGFRYTIDTKFKQFHDFSNYWTSIGYSGIVLIGGIRLGIVF